MSDYEEWASNIQTLPQNQGSPQPQTSSWDYVVIGGEVCPGVARVSVRAGDGLDIQKPKGGKRATVVDNGDPLVEFEVEVELLPDELQEFRDFILPILKPTGKSKGRAPLEILHPMAELWGISTIIIRGISTPHPESGGTMKIKISAIEYAPGPAPVKRQQYVKSKALQDYEDTIGNLGITGVENLDLAFADDAFG